jgi:NADPH2:quinone reductase
MGVRVLVTAGSDEKCQACLDLGADAAINYRTQDFQEEVLRLTEGRGADLILDMVAGDYIAREVQCLREDGRLVIIAVQGGVQSGFNAALVLRKRLTITGSTLRPRAVEFKAAIAQACLKHAWPLLVSRKIKPVIHSTFDARDAAQAHALMESNQHIGKIILTWGQA